jgi:hypothetical protein
LHARHTAVRFLARFLLRTAANFFHPGKLVWRLPSVGLAGNPAGVGRRVSRAARSAAGSRRGSVVGRRRVRPRSRAARAGSQLAGSRPVGNHLLGRHRAARAHVARARRSAAGAANGPHAVARAVVRREVAAAVAVTAASSRAPSRSRRQLRSRHRAPSPPVSKLRRILVRECSGARG